METEVFYAHALLAALPSVIIKNNMEPSQVTIAELAHDYASALTDTFKRNRNTYHESANQF
jgi:hypothetical protein